MVVEDDVTSREFLRRALEKNGCAVTTAEGVDVAVHLFAQRGFHSFDTVVTDHYMPGQTGLDLLTWLKDNDANLAGILLTSASERDVITESVRVGASDFLEKPVNLEKLFPALEKAVDTTQRRRRLAETESAVRSLGQAQAGLIQFAPVHTPGGPARLEVCFHPRLEAGGDFFSHFQPAPEKLCCLLTDVSGHDLQAAYVSAYFQGLVRGMLQAAVPPPEIFDCFNRFLVEEWNADDPSWWPQKKSSTSVAAVSVLLDFHAQTVNVLTCGTPAPVHIARDGRAKKLGADGGAALGWFDTVAERGSVHDLAGGGRLCVWTDGLEELADALGVQPLCLAYVLETAQRCGKKLPQLDHAPDDILVARIFLPSLLPDPAPAQALLLAEYHGGAAAEIDRLAADWRRNLEFAIPNIAEATLHDILLAAREAVLNAMTHGCAGDVAKRLRFQISHRPVKNSVKVWVDDPGGGHAFDFAAHAVAAAENILDTHRGLILMTTLAHAIQFERGGASVAMEFNL